MNNDYLIEEIKEDNYLIKIFQDTDSESPRDWDNLGTMVCAHKRYGLGDKQITGDYSSWKEAFYNYLNKAYNILKEEESSYSLTEKELKIIESWEEKHIIKLPLYLYDHSGITMNTIGFSCLWDSGQVGYIYVERGKAKKELCIKVMTKKQIKRIYEMLKQEVETYDKYLRVDTCGFHVYCDDEFIDSCFGFYEIKDAIDEAKSQIEYHKKTFQNIMACR